MEQASPSIRLQAAAANLLSDVKFTCRTSQKAVDKLVSGMENVIQTYLEVIQEKLRVKLLTRDSYIRLSEINLVLRSFEGQSIFEGLSTSTKVDSYLREKSGGDKVLLRQKVVEWKFKISPRGIPRKVPFLFGYCVPFLAQLQQILNCSDVLHCVDNPLPSQKGVYKTVTDGLFYKHHPVVVEHGPQTLAIIIHVDDAEICDALKSKANKNSLRLFYWVLGNIYPEKRSSLRALNLLAIAKARVAKKKGNGFLLRDFITDMTQLGTEGVDFTINGQTRRFYGVLIFAACDMPAAANLGKFKETHFALRPCRVCMVKSSCMCNDFRESRDLIRKLEEHNKQVDQVVGQLRPQPEEVIEIFEGAVEPEEESYLEVYTDHKDPSVNFGINGRSELSSVPHFDVTKCLPQDVMHMLNEGIVELVCRLLLREACCPADKSKPTLKIEELNHFIESMCDFGHLTADKPSRIEMGHIKGGKLKQSAAQMLVLMRILPFILHNRISDDKHELLLKLINVFDESMSFQFIQTDVNKLRDLIDNFGSHFKRLYPKIKTLKLHCSIHLPSQILLHGPLRQQSTMRSEAFHSEFTSAFPVVKTMKNPALSAAIRHLSKRNTEVIQRGKNGNYLTDDDVIRFSNNSVPTSDLPACICEIPGVSEQTVQEVKEFERYGRKWHEGVIILVKEDINLFARISRIYKIGEELFIVFNYLNTEFMACYNAFDVVKCLQDDHVIRFVDLDFKFPILRFSFSVKRKLKVFIMKEKPVVQY